MSARREAWCSERRAASHSTTSGGVGPAGRRPRERCGDMIGMHVTDQHVRDVSHLNPYAGETAFKTSRRLDAER